MLLLVLISVFSLVILNPTKNSEIFVLCVMWIAKAIIWVIGFGERMCESINKRLYNITFLESAAAVCKRHRLILQDFFTEDTSSEEYAFMFKQAGLNVALFVMTCICWGVSLILEGLDTMNGALEHKAEKLAGAIDKIRDTPKSPSSSEEGEDAIREID